MGSATHQVDPPRSGEDVLWLAPKVLAEAFRNLQERGVSASQHLTLPDHAAMSKSTNRERAAEIMCIPCQMDPDNALPRICLQTMHAYPHQSIMSYAYHTMHSDHVECATTLSPVRNQDDGASLSLSLSLSLSAMNYCGAEPGS